MFFFFKQKTAYEMRINDWSSDVGSSDLGRRDDRVVAEPGDEVAVDDAARHVEEIVGEFHIDAPDPSAGHARGVAVVEGIDDAAAGHQECVHRTALVELAQRPARHDEFVAAPPLLPLAGDGSGADPAVGRTSSRGTDGKSLVK